MEQLVIPPGDNRVVWLNLTAAHGHVHEAVGPWLARCQVEKCLDPEARPSKVLRPTALPVTCSFCKAGTLHPWRNE